MFVFTMLGALVVVPWYGFTFGYSTTAWVWFAVLLYANGLAITGGYHRLWSHKTYETVWPVLPGEVPDTAVEILRGTHPLELTRLAIVPALPFTDAPGRLSEPGLWFYLARWPWRDVYVFKDRAADTVVLSH